MPMNYVSKVMLDPKTRHNKAEQLILVLIRHFMKNDNMGSGTGGV